MALQLELHRELGAFPLDVTLDCPSLRLGILGPSGCGKSMTLKSIAGVVTPDQGRIQVEGRVLYDSSRGIHLAPRARKVGYLFQNYALFPTMTVEQNIAAGVRLPRARRTAQVKELIRRFRLEGLEHRYPGQISGGQQQRTALARMMAAQPQTILLDEPFSALDQGLREAVQEELEEFLQSFPGQVVMVSHRLEELYRFCAYLGVMERGRVIAAGPRDQVFAQPGSCAAARLLGWENLLPARWLDHRHMLLEGWEHPLTLAQPVPRAACALGLRADSPQPAWEPGENRIPVRLRSRVETPFRRRWQLSPPQGEGTLQWSPQGEDCPPWLWLPPEALVPLLP